MKTNELYLKFDELYKEQDFFDKLEITIEVVIPKIEEKNDNLYEIKEINCKLPIGKSEKLNKLKDKISDLNDSLDKYYFNGNSNWKLFYVYKELIQIFEELFDDSYTRNYYRGQAHDWQMKAGLFRNDVIDDFKKEFESIYEDIAYKYPETIQYVDINNKEELKYDKDFKLRENDMAYLQHYGLRTTLIDITENPFIGLLFLTSDINSFKNATFDMYNVNIKRHTTNNLFSRVKMLNRNKRIIAQKGAFFNFEKLLLLLNEVDKNVDNEIIDKIPLLRVKLNYNYEHIDYLNQKIHKMNQKIPLYESKIKYLEERIKSKDKIFEENMESLENMKKDENQDLEKFSEILSESKKIFKELKTKRNSNFTLRKKLSKLRKELKDLEFDKEKEINTIENYLYPEICKEIREKLRQYHYVENELFPDIYKHIGYIQNSFLSNNKNKDSIKIDDDSKNIMNLLEIE